MFSHQFFAWFAAATVPFVGGYAVYILYQNTHWSVALFAACSFFLTEITVLAEALGFDSFPMQVRKDRK